MRITIGVQFFLQTCLFTRLSRYFLTITGSVTARKRVPQSLFLFYAIVLLLIGLIICLCFEAILPYRYVANCSGFCFITNCHTTEKDRKKYDPFLGIIAVEKIYLSAVKLFLISSIVPVVMLYEYSIGVKLVKLRVFIAAI